MKTLKTSLLAVCMIVIASSFSKADPKPNPAKNVSYVIQQYIDGTTLGQVQNINTLLGDHFRHNFNRNGHMVTYTKKQLVSFLKSSKNIKQNCTTNYNIVEESEHCSIVKVEMKYPTFTKVDYVTLCREADEWKINQVITTYP